jgi:hypothetical protein
MRGSGRSSGSRGPQTQDTASLLQAATLSPRQQWPINRVHCPSLLASLCAETVFKMFPAPTGEDASSHGLEAKSGEGAAANTLGRSQLEFRSGSSQSRTTSSGIIQMAFSGPAGRLVSTATPHAHFFISARLPEPIANPLPNSHSLAAGSGTQLCFEHTHSWTESSQVLPRTQGPIQVELIKLPPPEPPSSVLAVTLGSQGK